MGWLGGGKYQKRPQRRSRQQQTTSTRGDQGKVFFALEGIYLHSPTYWIRFEKYVNTHLNVNLL